MGVKVRGKLHGNTMPNLERQRPIKPDIWSGDAQILNERVGGGLDVGGATADLSFP